MENASEVNAVEIVDATVCVKDADGKVPIHLQVKSPSSPKPGDVIRYAGSDYSVETVNPVGKDRYVLFGHAK